VTAAQTVPIVRDHEDDADAAAGEPAVGPDLRAFLPAIAGLLHDTAARFEETVARVTAIVMLQAGRAEGDLIVTLQDFDRLQQEFVALGDTLVRFAAASDDAASVRSSEFGNVISAIAVGDLRQRLLCRLEGKDPDFGVSIVSDEGTFGEEIF